MLAFICPHCGVRLQVQEEWAGRPLRCGGCKGLVTTLPPAPAVGSATLNPPTLPQSVPALDADVAGMLAPPQGPGELGRLGPYRVLGVLGQGGMGVVFRAEDTQLHRLVALKVMRPVLASNPANRRRFEREARAAAALAHDNIITVYHVSEDRGVIFLAMQLLEGESLEVRLRRQGRLSPAEAARIGRAVAEGLAAAHARGLVHRDIKPGNVWIEAPGGRVRVLDFGLARAVQEDLALTQSGALVGSPGYVAPEQVRGGPADPRSDLFSLGCVLYRMLTGRLPFTGPDTLAILAALAVQTPPPVRQLNPAVPPAFAALVMRLLEKDPALRPASARAVADALGALANGPTLPPEPARPLEPIPRTDTVPELLGVPEAAGRSFEDETTQVPLPPAAVHSGARRWLLAAALLIPLGLLLLLFVILGRGRHEEGGKSPGEHAGGPGKQPPPEGKPVGAERSQVDDLTVTALDLPVARIPRCLCWARDGKAFFLLDSEGGYLRRVALAGFKEEARDLKHRCSWLSVSELGLVLTVADQQAVWLLDPETLQTKATFEVGGVSQTVAAPSSQQAVAIDSRGDRITLLHLGRRHAPREYSARDLGGAGGLTMPALTPDGQHLFLVGGLGRLHRFKVEPDGLRRQEASPGIVQGARSAVEVSGDSKHVCVPSGGGNSPGVPGHPAIGPYATYIYPVNRLSQPAFVLVQGAYPRAVGFDPQAGLIYSQNHDHQLLIFDDSGRRLKEVVLGGGQTRQLLVHPQGRRLLVLTDSKLFHVEVPAK